MPIGVKFVHSRMNRCRWKRIHDKPHISFTQSETINHQFPVREVGHYDDLHRFALVLTLLTALDLI